MCWYFIGISLSILEGWDGFKRLWQDHSTRGGKSLWKLRNETGNRGFAKIHLGWWVLRGPIGSSAPSHVALSSCIMTDSGRGGCLGKKFFWDFHHRCLITFSSPSLPFKEVYGAAGMHHTCTVAIWKSTCWILWTGSFLTMETFCALVHQCMSPKIFQPLVNKELEVGQEKQNEKWQ